MAPEIGTEPKEPSATWLEIAFLVAFFTTFLVAFTYATIRAF